MEKSPSGMRSSRRAGLAVRNAPAPVPPWPMKVMRSPSLRSAAAISPRFFLASRSHRACCSFGAASFSRLAVTSGASGSGTAACSAATAASSSTARGAVPSARRISTSMMPRTVTPARPHELTYAASAMPASAVTPSPPCRMGRNARARVVSALASGSGSSSRMPAI